MKDKLQFESTEKFRGVRKRAKKKTKRTKEQK